MSQTAPEPTFTAATVERVHEQLARLAEFNAALLEHVIEHARN